jgi:hypothetical protein
MLKDVKMKDIDIKYRGEIKNRNMIEKMDGKNTLNTKTSKIKFLK